MLSAIQKFISKREPVFFEDSKVPVWLSKISPIEINALSFAFFGDWSGAEESAFFRILSHFAI